VVVASDVTDAQQKKWLWKQLFAARTRYAPLSAYEFLDYIATLKGLHHRTTRRNDVERAAADGHGFQYGETAHQSAVW